MRTPEQNKEYIKAYVEVYRNKKIFHCSVCNEDMIYNRKYWHLKKDYHLINVDNMVARGEKVPDFIRKASSKSNWQCPICNDGFIYKNRYQHSKSGYHRENIDKLVEKSLPVPNILVNKKIGLIVDV